MSSSPDADTASGSVAPTELDERPEPLTFTLNVLSGVDRINFPHLVATTTVKELKAKIRDALPSKPSDENQRLIHRGRMLGNETQTMADVFGKEVLTNPEAQTLHLVVREAQQASSTPNGSAHAIHRTPITSQFTPRPQSTPPSVDDAPPPHTLPGFQHIQHHQRLQIDLVHNAMVQRLQQAQMDVLRLQQEMVAMQQARAQLMADQTRAATVAVERASAAGQTTGSITQGPNTRLPAAGALPNLNQWHQARTGEGDRHSGTSSGRASPSVHPPEHTTTHTRQHIGPNGERWQVTVNATTTTFPIDQALHQHSNNRNHTPHNPANPAENIQAILRNADRIQAAEAAQNNVRENVAALQSTGNLLPVATPGTDRNAPSDVSAPSASGNTPNISADSQPTAASSNMPDALPDNPLTDTNSIPNVAAPVASRNVAYILYGPGGPRALVVSDSETFYTPRLPRPSRRHGSPATLQGHGLPQPRLQGFPDARNRVARPQAPQPNIPINQAAPGAAAAANGAPVQAIRLVWLAVRLMVFVWFFTSGNLSWSRFITILALAIAVFIYNTEFLNGAIQRMWAPVRGHIENLIPLAAPALPEPAPNRRPGELDPAVVAARLVNEHREANVGWLMTQIRRAEHATLLFLASLVPGVGERHIAAREAVEAAAAAEAQRVIDEAANAERVVLAAIEEANAEQQQTGEGGENQNDAPAVAPVNDEPPVPRLIDV